MEQKIFQQELLAWYDYSKRILPWRDNPTPYRVWISEIMLQQTKVETVIPYFNRFVQELPDVYSLSTVDDDYLNKLWEGLGYYSRVRNLKKAAIQIVSKYNGEIPNNLVDLESLSGIGPYTSGAILSIAYQQPFTAVDGNVLRVFARLTENRNNIKDVNIKKEIKDLVQSFLPLKRVGDFNQGLMEIGATVCLPNGAPLCEVCPLQRFCKSFKNGSTLEIPIKQSKKARKMEHKTVLVIKSGEKYALEKRPNQGLLAGLYQFPLFEGHLAIEQIQSLLEETKYIQKISSSKHIFTHLEWDIEAYVVEMNDQIGSYIWVNTEDIKSTYSIPTAFQTYKKMILGGVI